MSDVPELIEPIPVLFQQINKAATTYSTGVAGRREIQNFVARDVTKTIEAQVAFPDTDQRPMYSQLGVDEQARGYLVVRYSDMQSLGITLKRGDKIIKLGNTTVEYFLLHGNGDPAAHFSSIGGFTLVRLYFSDREPKA